MSTSTLQFQPELLNGSTTVIIPSRKDWLQVALFPILVVSWVIVGIMAIPMLGTILFFLLTDILSGAESSRKITVLAFITLFTILFLSVWVSGGTSCIYAILWHIFGREVVTVSPKSLIIRRQIFFLGQNRVYQTNKIKNLRFSPPTNWILIRWHAETMWMFNTGNIAFDYDGKTHRFGEDIGESEAEEILTRIAG